MKMQSNLFLFAIIAVIAVTVGQVVYPETDTDEKRKPQSHVSDR